MFLNQDRDPRKSRVVMFEKTDIFGVKINWTIIQSSLDIPFWEKGMLFNKKNCAELRDKYPEV